MRKVLCIATLATIAALPAWATMPNLQRPSEPVRVQQQRIRHQLETVRHQIHIRFQEAQVKAIRSDSAERERAWRPETEADGIR